VLQNSHVGSLHLTVHLIIYIHIKKQILLIYIQSLEEYRQLSCKDTGQASSSKLEKAPTNGQSYHTLFCSHSDDKLYSIQIAVSNIWSEPIISA
jgi:hypothetical protein